MDLIIHVFTSQTSVKCNIQSDTRTVHLIFFQIL